MAEIKKGDIVARKSYDKDIFFKVIDVFIDKNKKKHALVKGIDMRLYASAPVEDLEPIEAMDVANYWKKMMKKANDQINRVFSRRMEEREKSFSRALKREYREQKKKIESFDKPGTVLHLDGDEDYLNLCLTTYRQMGVPAHGYHVAEERQPRVVAQYLEEHRPDILVLTGHDGFVKGKKDYKDVRNYHNSQNFIDAVRAARHYEKNMDDLIIFAGACQSYYEAILESGANFASSPKRVLIHAFDPVFVVEKIAFTSIYDPVPLKDVIDGTITGFDGIGGFERLKVHSEF
ncbi:spore coat assembly protein [Desulfohalotomaculum tongense]|uniref:sporulation peptidase YabG n=1 Tax=Desulforadius tongensis TaxID=1216062 RepID=UPI0019594BD3|nr:sporulation peptidase YabG [Desulforadius tongensis]MBM7855182.1 spore coat assembly protein [Desulforadius tongensis]